MRSMVEGAIHARCGACPLHRLRRSPSPVSRGRIASSPARLTPSRPRGALPEAFESGAASALATRALPSRRFAALGSVAGGRASGARLTRCWADPSQRSDQGPPPPGFGAQEGAFPGILAAASPVPVKTGSVRTHLRRWRPATDGRHKCRSAGPGTKSAAREVWFGSAPGGSPSFLILPVHVRPDASTDQASRSPRGPRMLLDHRPGPKRPRERRRVA